MSPYQFTPLSAHVDRVRLLSLLPSAEAQAPLRCELFEFALQVSDPDYQPYEALSYVWGSGTKPRSIAISGQEFNVTDNLYSALSRLRHPCIARLLWIDAMCINQNDQKEKESQIRFMTVIYAKASRVLVWLGEAGDDSDQAIKVIRRAAMNARRQAQPAPIKDLVSRRGPERSRSHPLPLPIGNDLNREFSELERELSESSQRHALLSSIEKLLHRPWFRRTWVLQEVAAARHVLILCGDTEIDGYAFCVGLYSLPEAPGCLAAQVANVMRDAAFRPTHLWMTKDGRASLGLYPFSQLVDMYSQHEASQSHDRVFALLGMSTDMDLWQLRVDYSIPVNEMWGNTARHILGTQVIVKVGKDSNQPVLIVSSGCVLGRICAVKRRHGNSEITLRHRSRMGADLDSKSLRNFEESHWTFPAPAKSIEVDDIVYLCGGALRPSIIREQEGFFEVIIMAIKSPDYTGRFWRHRRSFRRNLSLIWNWTSDSQNDAFFVISPWDKETLNQRRAIDLWTRAQVHGDIGNQEKADDLRKLAEEAAKLAAEDQQALLTTNGKNVPLLWASEYGYTEAVRSMLAAGVGPNVQDWAFRSPLWLASAKGHVEIVVSLLKHKANIDTCDSAGWSPLCAAVAQGHESVVALLLEAGAETNLKMEVDWTSFTRKHGLDLKAVPPWEKSHATDVGTITDMWTVLHLAASVGQVKIVTQILGAGVEADPRSRLEETPLLLAVMAKSDAVVQVLLESGANVNARNVSATDSLLVAAEHGSPRTIKTLLAAGAIGPRLGDGSPGIEASFLFIFRARAKEFRAGAGPDYNEWYKHLMTDALSSGNFAIFKLFFNTRKKATARARWRLDRGLRDCWCGKARRVSFTKVFQMLEAYLEGHDV